MLIMDKNIDTVNLLLNEAKDVGRREMKLLDCVSVSKDDPIYPDSADDTDFEFDYYDNRYDQIVLLASQDEHWRRQIGIDDKSFGKIPNAEQVVYDYHHGTADTPHFDSLADAIDDMAFNGDDNGHVTLTARDAVNDYGVRPYFIPRDSLLYQSIVRFYHAVNLDQSFEQNGRRYIDGFVSTVEPNHIIGRYGDAPVNDTKPFVRSTVGHPVMTIGRGFTASKGTLMDSLFGERADKFRKSVGDTVKL